VSLALRLEVSAAVKIKIFFLNKLPQKVHTYKLMGIKLKSIKYILFEETCAYRSTIQLFVGM